MYYPYQKGRYEVAPGLLPFPRDFGNGDWDRKLFQIGDDFKDFRDQFELNRSREPVSKYVCFSDGSQGPSADPSKVGAISAFMARRLAIEYPSQIVLEEDQRTLKFKSQLTGDSFTLLPASNAVTDMKGHTTYTSAWDAMGAQVPEDLAIWCLNDDGSEHLEALHLNTPNYWGAADKIGRSFAQVHLPVAHIEKIVPWAVNLLEGIIERGPFIRFAWGVVTDSRYNHHPEVAPGVDPKEWHGRSFNPDEPELYARVERQVLWGFSDSNRALFTIRTYFHKVSDLKKTRPEAVSGLIDAIESMSPESLEYKGLTHHKESVLNWLRSE